MKGARNKGRTGTPCTGKGGEEMKEWVGEEELVGLEGGAVVSGDASLNPDRLRLRVRRCHLPV